MVKMLRNFTLLASLIFLSFGSFAQEVFINEIHYDNVGGDVGESIEIAGPAGKDLTGWSLILYNGSNGTVYGTTALSGTLANLSNGFGFFTIVYPANGIQNGAPDAMALVDNGTVVQFLSYEGAFTAVGGPADGMLSTDIGVSETSSQPIGESLQLTGSGKLYTDFTWVSAKTATFGASNGNQTFLGEPIVFVNEFHYDNVGADIEEGIELAGTAGFDLAGWKIVLYNGSNGASYGTTNLTGTFAEQDNGFGTLFFAISELQNGSPDGFALVNSSDEVIQFLSYEGGFAAVGGPADGLASTDINVVETTTTPVGFSLQLQGTGSKYEDFTWAANAIAKTYNAINTGQSFGGVIVIPEPELVTIAVARTKPQGTKLIIKGVLTASDQLGSPAFIQDATGGIAVFDAQIHGMDVFEIGDDLELTGSIGAFNQQVQLVDVTKVELISSGVSISPKIVSIAEINASIEGQLVSIPATSFVISKGLFFPESNYDILDGTGTIALRIDGDVGSLIGRVIPNEAQLITGVLGSFRGTIQLLPRFLADLPGTSAYEVVGSDIPTTETLDVMTWNMEFFGSTITNFGPSNVTLQAANALKVFQATLPDIIAVQEVSDEELLTSLVAQLPGYAVLCSDRFSRSFDGPDPTFPAQKICFIYNTAVIDVLSEQVLFEELYDQARLGLTDALDGYPTGSASSFWSSGRLPWMLTATADINGVKEKIRFINIHAKSGSANADLMRKRFDIQVLKDSLDAFYSMDNIILLGDYNDDLDQSIGTGPSTYEVFISDPDFDGVTISLSEAGLRSFIFNDNVIDHIIISNELYDNYLEGSETLFIPFNLIENYGNTTSDHLPVSVRLLAGDPVLSNAGQDAVVYLGYDPLASTTLSASDATGGTGPYTYTWSTGQTGQIIIVAPTVSTTYILTVADQVGNIVVDEVSVCVVDVRCGPKGDKVAVCRVYGNSGKSNTICVAPQAVAAMLKNGASLGACGSIPCRTNAPEPTASFAEANVKLVFPNPLGEQVEIQLDLPLDLDVAFVLFSESGKIMQSGTAQFKNGKLSLDFGNTSLKKGFYYLHINYGQETKRIRLMKK
jgi:endonuclease/exonuclease/phosphatase family metal-dependent hydrolase